jgi:hypothetical protein
VEHPSRELGDLSIGEHPVEFQIANSTDRPLRILGFDGGGCTASYCFRSMVDVPDRAINPGEAFVFRCLLQLHKPGEFNCSFVLFLEDGGTRKMTLSVKGIGVKEKDSVNDRSTAKP